MIFFAPEGRFPAFNSLALKLMGAVIGKDSVIYSSIYISKGISVTIGERTFLGSGSVFTGGVGSSIIIGCYCDISDHVHFVTGSHLIDSCGTRVAGDGISMDIRVGNGVWIGYRSLILPGVTIGDNAVIAAGTTVHKDVPSKTLVGGSPMRILRHL